jgi:hypothetical protein
VRLSASSRRRQSPNGTAQSAFAGRLICAAERHKTPRPNLPETMMAPRIRYEILNQDNEPDTVLHASNDHERYDTDQLFIDALKNHPISEARDRLLALRYQTNSAHHRAGDPIFKFEHDETPAKYLVQAKTTGHFVIFRGIGDVSEMSRETIKNLFEIHTYAEFRAKTGIEKSAHAN